jgi:hypothetical protein
MVRLDEVAQRLAGQEAAAPARRRRVPRRQSHPQLSIIVALVQIAVNSKNASVRAVETSSPHHGIPDLRRSLALNAQTSQSELSLPDAVQ